MEVFSVHFIEVMFGECGGFLTVETPLSSSVFCNVLKIIKFLVFLASDS